MEESLLDAKLAKALRVPSLLLDLVDLHSVLARVDHVNHVSEGARHKVALVTETAAHWQRCLRRLHCRLLAGA